jgi:hypothetical protein
MTQDVGSYQPEESCTVTFFLQQQINGKKSYIKASSIKHLVVPQYDTLSVEEILKWVRANHPTVIDRYLPTEQKDIDKLPRQVSTCSLSGCYPGS